MFVVKRDGRREEVSFDKVLERIKRASEGLAVNSTAIAQKILAQIYDGVKTTELDELTSQLSANLATVHPDYGTLAARISVSNHHKNTEPRFTKVVWTLSHQVAPKTGEPLSYLSDELQEICAKHGDEIDAEIQHDRDYLFDYFGFKTLERSYLLKDSNGVIIERPQHLWMRVSLALWGSVDLKRAFETYHTMSQKYFTHATPTLFNAGTPRQQLSSCFLLAMSDDSIAGIYKSLSDCALISKYAGGIGLHCHNIRAKGSIIRGTNGTSNGLVPMLRVFNNTARYVDQCFTPDTLVYTRAGPKAIEDVSVSDEVLSSNGTYEKVKLPIRHEYSGKMLDIQVKNAVYPVRVTPEHQVYALQGQQKGLNFDVIKNRLEKGIKKPEFVDANDLVEGDFVVYPIPTYEHDIDTLSEDDCRFYGILVGDGYISGSVSGVHLNTTTKQETATFVLTYLENRGVKVSLYQETETGLSIKWSTASPGFKFTRSQLYNMEKTKIIDTSFIHLPKSKILQVLRGIIETDGCVGEKEISVELTSAPVIESMRYMLIRLGALASGYERNRIGNVSTYKDITTRKETMVLRIPRIQEILAMFPSAPKGEYMTYLCYGNNIYSRIQTITETTYSGIVHDFEIDGPHDYTLAHLGIVHNGGGKRNGSFAMYLEPWHADVEDFLRLKLNSGTEEERARDLFYALWVSDLFMKRVEADADWTLFCPAEAPGLADKVGAEFEALYEQYEREGRGRKTIKAQKLWFQILDTQMETGTPYICYKDAANLKSNQQNLGVIKSSNLCTEIIEYSDKDETAVCNLASIGLPAFVEQTEAGPVFNFDKLRHVVEIATRNLNRVIDINYYPTPETLRSNMRHRPIGLGVQGLADVFALMRYPWDSQEAATLNQRIAEHIYFAALKASCKAAAKEGTYETYEGSPISKGQLQFDMWNVTPMTALDGTLPWEDLRQDIRGNGVRNSLLLAPMPTASTSQILGYNECFEPFTSNIYSRRTLAGEFIVMNKYLLRDLVERGIWNETLKQKILALNGSVQGISEIPADIQALYRTAWELKQRTLIDLAAARGAFICQSQSLNLFVADPSYAKLSSMHIYSWKKGLKTGCYYLRTRAAVMAQKFTVDPALQKALELEQSQQQQPAQQPQQAPDADAKKKAERKARLEQLAREYEEEQQKAREAAENGEGCLMCSG